MVLGATQHHVAVIPRFSTVYIRSVQPGKDGFSLVVRRAQSTITRTSHQSIAQENSVNVPDDCIDHDTKYPDLTLSKHTPPKQNIDTIDLDKTRPARLQSPPSLDPKDFPATNGKPPISDRAKHLFKIGKSYLAFYKTGFKNVWNNYKQTRVIQERVTPNTADAAAKYGGQVRSGSIVPEISHAEYQFYIRSRHDIFKLIPFSLVFAICGEFTPLVIIALGTVVVPYTCRIPQQVSKDLHKKLKRDREYMAIMAKDVRSSQTIEDAQSRTPTKPQQQTTAWRQEWTEAYRYGLTSFRQPIPILGYLYHQYILQPRLVKHCNTLLCNTILIHREGGFAKLDARSIFEWADKYSLHALNQYIETHNEKARQKTNTGSESITISLEDLCTEEFKRHLAPACTKEAGYILRQDWTRLKPTCHWRTTFRSVANSNDHSPDTERRRDEIERMNHRAMTEGSGKAGEQQ